MRQGRAPRILWVWLGVALAGGVGTGLAWREIGLQRYTDLGLSPLALELWRARVAWWGGVGSLLGIGAALWSHATEPPLRRAFLAALAPLPVAGMLTVEALISGLFTRPPPHGPHVVLLSVGGLGAGGVGTYGFLDEPSERGVRFENAYVASRNTLPAVASLLTSLPPVSHQAIFDLPQMDGLHPAPPTMAEVFRNAGYRTGGFVLHPHLAGAAGFDQGFHTYRDHRDGPRGEEAARASWLRTEALDFARRYREERLMLFVHFPADEHGKVSSAAEREIPALLEGLADLQVRRRSIVVLTSDRGSRLPDDSLREPGIRVPLVMYGRMVPARGEVVAEPVSLLDVLPTILDLAHVDAPPTVQGRSLAGLVAGDPDEFPHVVAGGTGRSAAFVRQGSLKYVRVAVRRGSSEDRPDPHREPQGLEERLFDLAADPQEAEDLAPTDPVRLEALRRVFERLHLHQVGADRVGVPPTWEPSLEERDLARRSGEPRG